MLLVGLAAQVADADLPITEYLVGNLDERGYLSVRVEDAARALDISQERVLAVLTVLQSLEPAGIGARDLRECMAIQLNMLAENGIANPVASAIVERNLLKALARTALAGSSIHAWL